MFKFNFNIEEDPDNQNRKLNEDEQFGALNQDFGYIHIDDLPSTYKTLSLIFHKIKSFDIELYRKHI